MNRKFAVCLLALALQQVALAGVKVTSLDLKTQGTQGSVHIGLDGRSSELPDVKVNGKIIEIILSKAENFSAITRNIQGAQLTASVVDGKAIIKATLPYEVKADALNVGFKNKNIEIVFPRGTVTKVTNDVPAAVAEKKNGPKNEPVREGSLKKEALIEDYLNSLMKENTARNDSDKPADVKKDEVSVKQASAVKTAIVPAAKNASNNFSFAGYAAKFTVFLALVLGLFYGIVQLLKKGVFKRGKLGFLNNTQMIEVLSTTYVSPKRSLMIVKAHKQIFLVANSENGLEFLSEMKDTAGLLKEGEKIITGSNFDSDLGSAELTNTDEGIKLKENILESTPVEEKTLSKMAVAKDIVKFSDELKKKAKKLKPIEFN